MSLYQAMVSDPELDAEPDGALERAATNSGVGERAKALWSLSRRVTVDSLPGFVRLLEHEQNQMPIMFGRPPVDHSGIIALLVNSSGEVHAEAERLWFELSFAERHDLKTWLEPDGFDLPLLEKEQHQLDQAVAVATEKLGPAEWNTSPQMDGLDIVATEPHPGRRSMIVAPDGSALLLSGQGASTEETEAFNAGARSTAEDFRNYRP